jgi:hypothetical protein
MFVPISSTWQLMRERQIIKSNEKPAADKPSQTEVEKPQIPPTTIEQIQDDQDPTG